MITEVSVRELRLDLQEKMKWLDEREALAHAFSPYGYSMSVQRKCDSYRQELQDKLDGLGSYADHEEEDDTPFIDDNYEGDQTYHAGIRL